MATPGPAAPVAPPPLPEDEITLEIPEGYVVQDIPERYMRSRVLQDFIKARPDEFGNSPRFQMKRDTHRIVVKRELTKDEIKALQRESFPEHFANSDWA